MLLKSQLDYPQLFTDSDFDNTTLTSQTEPSLYREDGKLYLRHFLISDKHFNNQLWRVENLAGIVKSYIGKPLILTPTYNHVFDPDRDKWLKIQEPYTIGIGVDVVYNKKTGAYDAITEITNAKAEAALEKGYLPPFVSPGFLATKYREQQEDGRLIRVFEDGEIMHDAIVISPAFRPKSLATIADIGCRGTRGLCAMKLAAIASDKELDTSPDILLKKFYDAYIDENGKNTVNKMVEKDNDDGKVVNTLLDKLQRELSEKNSSLEKLNERLKALEESEKKNSSELGNITKERDELKTKFTAIEQEKTKAELKKSFNEKLAKTKMYHSDEDARNKKVEELVDKNFKIEDLDMLYENMFYTEDELKKLDTETTSKTTLENPATDKRVGIASTIQTSKKNNTANVLGALVLEEILEL